MTNREAISELQGLRRFVEGTRLSGELRIESIDMAIEALKNIQALDKIPTNYLYDTETEHCLVYRHKYTGKEIHILKPTDLFVLERPHGEWIETSNIWETEDLSGWGYWKECSSCHCQEKRRTSFCPNCGSDNRPRKHGCCFADETCKKNPCEDCGLREGESE